MNNITKKRIEELANNVRKVCSTDDYGIINIFDSVAALGYKLIRYPLGNTDILGFAQLRDEDRIIFSNSSQILSREIFTLAHELAHHELGHIDLHNLTITDCTLLGDSSQETEANLFAAALLVPDDKLASFVRNELQNKPSSGWNSLDIARMQTAFNVSYDMILNRLEALGYIDNMIHTRLNDAKTQRSVSSLLRIIDGSDALCRSCNSKRIPPEYMNWVFENYRMKLIPKQTVEKALSYFDELIPEDILSEEVSSDVDIDIDAFLGDDKS